LIKNVRKRQKVFNAISEMAEMSQRIEKPLFSPLRHYLRHILAICDVFASVKLYKPT